MSTLLTYFVFRLCSASTCVPCPEYHPWDIVWIFQGDLKCFEGTTAVLVSPQIHRHHYEKNVLDTLCFLSIYSYSCFIVHLTLYKIKWFRAFETFLENYSCFSFIYKNRSKSGHPLDFFPSGCFSLYLWHHKKLCWNCQICFPTKTVAQWPHTLCTAHSCKKIIVWQHPIRPLQRIP